MVGGTVTDEMWCPECLTVFRFDSGDIDDPMFDCPMCGSDALTDDPTLTVMEPCPDCGGDGWTIV